MTVLLLPGNMCDARLWQHVRTAGMADADLSLDDTITSMAARALEDHPGMLLPVGFSMGGIVALEMARLAPERICGLVLADTNAGADLRSRAAARPGQQARVRTGELATIIADELKPAYLADHNRDNAALKALLFEMGMALGPDVFIRQSEALRTRADLGPVLDAFAGPVLLMCGRQDRLCPPDWHEAMAARCRRPTLAIISDAGHMLPLEQPAAFSAVFARWRAEFFKETSA